MQIMGRAASNPPKDLGRPGDPAGSSHPSLVEVAQMGRAGRAILENLGGGVLGAAWTGLPGRARTPLPGALGCPYLLCPAP